MAQWLLSTGLRLWAVLTLGLGDFKVFEVWGSSLRACLGRERERGREREGGELRVLDCRVYLSTSFWGQGSGVACLGLRAPVRSPVRLWTQHFGPCAS